MSSNTEHEYTGNYFDDLTVEELEKAFVFLKDAIAEEYNDVSGQIKHHNQYTNTHRKVMFQIWAQRCKQTHYDLPERSRLPRGRHNEDSDRIPKVFRMGREKTYYTESFGQTHRSR